MILFSKVIPMAETTIARAILVDSSSIFCDGIRKCLNQGGHLVLTQAHNLDETFRQLEAVQPNVAILGPNLTENEALAICREMSCRWPDIKTIIVSSYAQDTLFRADAIYAGAAGCLLPTANQESYLEAITMVMTGKNLFRHEELAPGYQPIRLTMREREILKLLGEGKGTQEIAQLLGTRVSTIRNHIQHILEKLQVHNRQAAVRRARRRGWPV